MDGVGPVGNCGLTLNVSVSLAQVSNVALLPPALVLTAMKNCHDSWSDAFIAGFWVVCADACNPENAIATTQAITLHEQRVIWFS
jgi:hypothetical protein